jgi:predicted nucleic acid-binding protein
MLRLTTSTTLEGGTFAELADHVQGAGGLVTAVVTLVNDGRIKRLRVEPRVIKKLQEKKSIADCAQKAFAGRMRAKMRATRGRKVAKINQIKTVGAVGVLLQAKRAGLILRVAPLIEQIAAIPVFMGEDLIQTVLELAGESAAHG